MDASFVILITIGSASLMVEARYCPIEIDGDVKYYIYCLCPLRCPRHEICCTFGCCISSNFHFSQLWYYWLMVILMFLLCSGGTWWYRYWLQGGHYANTVPPPPRVRHRPSPARVTYHAGRNTVVLQQVWKPQRNGPVAYPTPPPSYSFVRNTNATVSQSTSGAGMEVVSGPSLLKASPYYQLYGPPPSYDSVVAERRLESQARPEHEQTQNNHSSETPLPLIQSTRNTSHGDANST